MPSRSHRPRSGRGGLEYSAAPVHMTPHREVHMYRVKPVHVTLPPNRDRG
jgi:hypothetical protein